MGGLPAFWTFVYFRFPVAHNSYSGGIQAKHAYLGVAPGGDLRLITINAQCLYYSDGYSYIVHYIQETYCRM